MKGTKSHESEVPHSASEVWEIYGTHKIAELLPRILCERVQKIDIKEGDGTSVGSILHVTFPPGLHGGPSYQKEKYVKVDNKQRIKEVILMEGGMLDLGFKSYLIRFQILEKTNESSTIVVTIEYEIDDDHVDMTAYIDFKPFATIAEGVSEYLLEMKNGCNKI